MGKKHTHKYFRMDMNYDRVWACALPDCTHYMPKHMEQLVSGKKSICWECGNEFNLNPINMVKDKPVCEDCSEEINPILKTLREIEANQK